MRALVFVLVIATVILSASPAFAGRKYNSNSGYTKDVYGSWERTDNAYRDSDGDGVVNHYDSNNRDSSRW